MTGLLLATVAQEHLVTASQGITLHKQSNYFIITYININYHF